jgi:hypothetical protein
VLLKDNNLLLNLIILSDLRFSCGGREQSYLVEGNPIYTDKCLLNFYQYTRHHASEENLLQIIFHTGHILSVKHSILRRMPSSWMLRLVAIVRTDVSGECIASIIKVTRIIELRKTSTITSCEEILCEKLIFLAACVGC